MKRTSTAIALALLTGMSGAVHAADAPPVDAAPLQKWQKGLSRTDLARQSLSAAGYELIQSRVDFEPGVVSPRHSHPGEEVAFVIEGVMEYQLAGRPPVTLKAGSALVIPAGTPHIARNVGTGRASELATYVVRIGVPLVKIEE